MKSLRYSAFKTDLEQHLKLYQEHAQAQHINLTILPHIQNFKIFFTLDQLLKQYLGSKAFHKLIHCLIRVIDKQQPAQENEQQDIYDRLLKMEVYKCPSDSQQKIKKHHIQQIKNELAKSDIVNLPSQQKIIPNFKENIEAIIKILSSLSALDEVKQEIILIIEAYQVQNQFKCQIKSHQDIRSLWRKINSQIKMLKDSQINLNNQELIKVSNFMQIFISLHNQIQIHLNNFIKMSEKENSDFDANSSSLTSNTTKRSLLTEIMKEFQQKKNKQKKSVSQSLKQYRLQSFQNNGNQIPKIQPLAFNSLVKNQYKSGQIFGHQESLPKKIKNVKTKSQKLLLPQIQLNIPERSSIKKNKQIKASLNNCANCSQCIIF